MDMIFEFLGKMLFYGGGSAAVAYLLFQYLGKAWIENKFKQRLEQLKHEQNLEVQRLRVDVDAILRGVVKLQEKEFEILPAVWRRLYHAKQAISSLVSPRERYLKLDSFNEEQLEDVLAETKFMASQKNEIRRSNNKTNLYRELSFRYQLNEVNGVFCDLIGYFSENGILLYPELKKKVNRACELLHSALSSKEIGRECGDWKMQNEGWKKLKDEVEPLITEIERDIYTRLQSHGRSSMLITENSSKNTEVGSA